MDTNAADTATADGEPPHATPPRPGPAGAGFFDSIRRTGLSRGDDRWVGGVCSGLAARAGIDPIVVRGLFAVAVLLGGLGLVVYGVGWALLPERQDGRIHLEQAIAGRFDPALAGAILVTVVGAARGNDWLWPWGVPGWFQALAWLALTGGVIALLVTALHQRTAGNPGTAHPSSAWAPPPTGSSSAAGPPWGMPASTSPPPWGPPGTPVGAAGVPPARRRGPGSTTVGIVVALALLGWAGILVAERTGVDDGPVLLTALGLGVVLAGLGIMVAGLRGRRSGVLGFLAIVGLALASPMAAARGGVDGWTWQGGRAVADTGSVVVLSDATAARRGVSTGLGDLTIDLSGLGAGDLSADERTVVPISVGAGDLVVLLPDDADVSVRVDVRAGAGTIRWDVDGDRQSIDGVGLQHTFERAAGAHRLVLDVSVGVGDIRLEEARS